MRNIELQDLFNEVLIKIGTDYRNRLHGRMEKKGIPN